MNEPLFSPLWYRVADLKPVLRTHTGLHRHVYREQVWYVLQDKITGKFQRFSPPAYHAIAQMDGNTRLEDIWHQVNTRYGDDAPTQDEMIRLLGQLHSADVLQCDVTPDADELLRRGQKQARSKLKQRFWNPMALRFPLVDPDRFLKRGLGLIRTLFTWTALVVWLVVVGIAFVLAMMHWQDLTHDVMGRVLATHNLLLLFLIYPIVKLAHELGHAWATRVRGGEVHEMGVMLLVLMPIPYVDASASSAFQNKRHRMLVAAAGMLVELFLASIALFVWLNAEPGLVSAIAFNVMLIGGVSTLLFNGNPLLRFDGYYILADAIEIPNLATRANQYIGYLLQHHVFGIENARSPVSAPGEAPWLLFYAVASFFYRMFILAVIALFIAGKFFFVGVAIAVWAVIIQIILPMGKHLRFLLVQPQVQRHRTRVLAASLTTAGLLGALLFAVPIPLWTHAQGVVWLPERAQVRAGTDCFIERLLVDPGHTVRAGDALARCVDPFLDVEVKVLAAKLRELNARYKAVSRQDRMEAEIVREEKVVAQADLDRANERLAALTLRANDDGKFVVQQAKDLPGRFIAQGELLGYVLDQSSIAARVVVPQSEIGLMRTHIEKVHVRLAENLASTLPAEVERQVPAATDKLPSMALGTAGGGAIPVDPTDTEGLTPLQNVFQYELRLPAEAGFARPGGRIFARFEHGEEPLGMQWYRRVRQLFLRRFHV